MSEEAFFVVSEEIHNQLVTSAFKGRGYSEREAGYAARFAAYATWHGIRTHNAIKALHLDHIIGSGAGGCVPGVDIEKLPNRFPAVEIWNSNRKLGQAVATEAMETCMRLADQYGLGMVNVDNAFHYLWGGGHVMNVAKKGYIGYTNCTASYAEVVPFLGKSPTLGTNPHSWGFPTTEVLGYPIVIDWATSVISTGRKQQLEREGKPLPPDSAIDADGNMTTDPGKAVNLLPFGAHKGYSLSLLNEIVAAMIGGSLPTIRSRWAEDGEKHTTNFHFQVIHPDALSAGAFSNGRSQMENVKAVIDDVLGHGNENCMLPGEIEAQAASRSETNGGLLFTAAELDEFDDIAAECGYPKWDRTEFKQAE